MNRTYIPLFVGLGMILITAMLIVSSLSLTDTTTPTVDVANATPTVSNLIFATSSGGSDFGSTNVILTEFTTTSVFIRGTITDSNGCFEVADNGSANIDFGIDNVVPECSSSQQNDRTCYYLDSTSNRCNFGVTDTCDGGTDTTVDFECDFHIVYYARPSVTGTFDASAQWAAQLRAIDGDGATGLLTDFTEVETLLAINVSSSVNYGTLALGATSATAIPLNIINSGNITTDLNVLGSDMPCSIIGTVPAENQHFSLSNSFVYASGTPLSDTSTTFINFDLVAGVTGFEQTPSNDDVYWKIQLPAEGLAGNCTGTTTVTAIENTI